MALSKIHHWHALGKFFFICSGLISKQQFPDPAEIFKKNLSVSFSFHSTLNVPLPNAAQGKSIIPIIFTKPFCLNVHCV